jgi:hypothetical protein
MYPVWIVDYGNEVEKDLAEDWLRLIIEQIAVMTVSMLMQRLEKSTMECIVPMQAIAVFPLVL